MSAWRQTGIQPDELRDVPEFPISLAPYWGYFLDISRQRGNNGFGPSPLAYESILAWCKLTGVRLSGWALDLILKLDSAYLSCINKAGKGS